MKNTTRKKPHRWLWAHSPKAEEWAVCATIEECIDEWRGLPDEEKSDYLYVCPGHRTTAAEREEWGFDYRWHCTGEKPVKITP